MQLLVHETHCDKSVKAEHTVGLSKRKERAYWQMRKWRLVLTGAHSYIAEFGLHLGPSTALASMLGEHTDPAPGPSATATRD